MRQTLLRMRGGVQWKVRQQEAEEQGQGQQGQQQQ